MSASITPSQTVGPFFGVGLPFEKGEQIAPAGSAGSIRIEGQVLDGHGDPVPDALLEVWQPETTGLGRCRTDAEGAFNFVTVKPGPSPAPDGRLQAPHLNVTVFARGLLRHLVTRMYFPDEGAANSADPVLNVVDPERRSTLVAREDGGVLRFDIQLQGEQETVFFVI
ncbi:MAG: protocatechuate 3,4-dioxygenase subunit alpha [Chloroflexi bacterium]|nr:MAG: protocatechuate 3,4-dioxygenase subunit alpha [Chloroflexota bacterium]